MDFLSSILYLLVPMLLIAVVVALAFLLSSGLKADVWARYFSVLVVFAIPIGALIVIAYCVGVLGSLRSILMSKNALIRTFILTKTDLNECQISFAIFSLHGDYDKPPVAESSTSGDPVVQLHIPGVGAASISIKMPNGQSYKQSGDGSLRVSWNSHRRCSVAEVALPENWPESLERCDSGKEELGILLDCVSELEALFEQANTTT